MVFLDVVGISSSDEQALPVRMPDEGSAAHRPGRADYLEGPAGLIVAQQCLSGEIGARRDQRFGRVECYQGLLLPPHRRQTLDLRPLFKIPNGDRSVQVRKDEDRRIRTEGK